MSINSPQLGPIKQEPSSSSTDQPASAVGLSTSREKRIRKQKQYDSDFLLYDNANNCIEMKLNELETPEAATTTPPSANTSGTDCTKYQVGDLVWAKVSGHPWWPCIVSRDSTGSHVKEVGTSRPKRHFYVEFFGPAVEHAWVAEGGLIEYKGIEAFKTYAQDQVDQAPTKSAKEKLAERFQLKVALTRRDHWETGVEEADEALTKKRADDRMLIIMRKKSTDENEENVTPNASGDDKKLAKKRLNSEDGNLKNGAKRKRLTSLANSDEPGSTTSKMQKFEEGSPSNNEQKVSRGTKNGNSKRQRKAVGKPAAIAQSNNPKSIDIRKPKFLHSPNAEKDSIKTEQMSQNNSIETNGCSNRTEKDEQTQNLALLSQIASSEIRKNCVHVASLLRSEDERRIVELLFTTPNLNYEDASRIACFKVQEFARSQFRSPTVLQFDHQEFWHYFLFKHPELMLKNPQWFEDELKEMNTKSQSNKTPIDVNNNVKISLNIPLIQSTLKLNKAKLTAIYSSYLTSNRFKRFNVLAPDFIENEVIIDHSNNSYQTISYPVTHIVVNNLQDDENENGLNYNYEEAPESEEKKTQNESKASANGYSEDDLHKLRALLLIDKQVDDDAEKFDINAPIKIHLRDILKYPNHILEIVSNCKITV